MSRLTGAEYSARSYAKHREARQAASRAYHLANRDQINERQRHAKRLRKFGVTADQFGQLLEVQERGCRICRAPAGAGDGRSLCVDHDHETGAVRGLLCGECNTGLGKFKDSPFLLESALAYLEGRL